MPIKCGQTITVNDYIIEWSETGWWCMAQCGEHAKVTKRTSNGWLFIRPLKKPTIGFWVRNSPSLIEKYDPQPTTSDLTASQTEEQFCKVVDNQRLKKELTDALTAKDHAKKTCARLNNKCVEFTDAHNELVEWVNEVTSLAQACYMAGTENELRKFEVRKLLMFLRKE